MHALHPHPLYLEDTLIPIFCHLEPESLSVLDRVCRKWQEVARCNPVNATMRRKAFRTYLLLQDSSLTQRELFKKEILTVLQFSIHFFKLKQKDLQAQAPTLFSIIKILKELINQPDEELFAYPIHQLIIKDNVEELKYGLKLGANIEVKIDAKYTPLTCAAYEGKEEMVEQLCQSGAQIKDPLPLYLAITQGHLNVVKILCKHGASIHEPVDSITPLHAAAMNTQIEIVRFLCEAGAKVNCVEDKYGYTALHIAVLSQCLDCVRILAHFKADARIRSKTGVTPLEIAFSLEDRSYVEILEAM